MGITKQDIRALRNANTLVFFHNVEYGGIWGSWVKAMKDGEKSGTGFSQEHWVRLEGTSIRNYEGGVGESATDYPNKGYAPEDLVGSLVLQSANFRLEVNTWLKVLREGDDLMVDFLVGNNTPVLDKAGLSRDEAWLIISRGPGSQAVGKYFLDGRTTPVHSDERMVRPAAHVHPLHGGVRR